MRARLEEKVCVVTGAASGIGAAIAQAFADEGAYVIVTDINEGPGAQLAESLGPRARFAFLDVTEEIQWRELLDDVAHSLGGLDVLVNNAGIGEIGGLNDPEHTPLTSWRRTIQVNLDSVFLGCKHAIRVMRETGRRGSILNMSSRSGLVGVPHAAAYAASKAAIRNHSKTVALYCAEQNLGIRCNTIFPASIMTPMWQSIVEHGNAAEMLADVPLHRFGRPEEVGALAVFLASDEATFITGSEFNIDGGVLAGGMASPK